MESTTSLDQLSVIIQQAFELEPDPAWDFVTAAGGLIGPESDVIVAEIGIEGLHFGYVVGALDTVEARIEVLAVGPREGEYPRVS